ncbi:transcriptional regulator [Rhodovibrio salinarum]|uniref:Transcriptional regulator n=2 Tax=Rhodovibrio salinarum TaxID=1087 RepID=A0A934UYX8_9PROT|nr:transcriptional regulator [Rhodovibrio salinarum]
MPTASPVYLKTAGDIGKLVRARRCELGMTQDEFAGLANVGRRFLIELEKGKPTLQIDRVLSVLQVCGYDLYGHRR